MKPSKKQSKASQKVESVNLDEEPQQETLTKKRFNKLKEIEAFYKIVFKYKLRVETYKSLLQMYIDSKLPKK